MTLVFLISLLGECLMIARLTRLIFLGLLLIDPGLLSVAQAVMLDHTFVLMLNHSSGTRMAIPPSITALEVTAPNSVQGGNPLYEGQMAVLSNPIYEMTAPPGTPGSVESVAIEFGATRSKPLDGEGVVHRDIATRSLQITTNEGIYEMAMPALLAFGNDGPADLRGVGPIRWMAPESIRTRTYTPTTGDARIGSWEIAALSYFDVSYPVPEPTSAALLLLPLSLAASRRRIR